MASKPNTAVVVSNPSHVEVIGDDDFGVGTEYATAAALAAETAAREEGDAAALAAAAASVQPGAPLSYPDGNGPLTDNAGNLYAGGSVLADNERNVTAENIRALGNFEGNGFGLIDPRFPQTIAAAYAATVAVNAAPSLNLIVGVGTLTGNILLANPTGAVDRTRIEYVLRQDATGGRTLTLDTLFRFPSSSTLSSPISAVNSGDFAAANKKSRLLVEYDAADNRFDVIAFVPGY